MRGKNRKFKNTAKINIVREDFVHSANITRALSSPRAALGIGCNRETMATASADLGALSLVRGHGW